MRIHSRTNCSLLEYKSPVAVNRSEAIIASHLLVSQVNNGIVNNVTLHWIPFKFLFTIDLVNVQHQMSDQQQSARPHSRTPLFANQSSGLMCVCQCNLTLLAEFFLAQQSKWICVFDCCHCCLWLKSWTGPVLLVPEAVWLTLLHYTTQQHGPALVSVLFYQHSSCDDVSPNHTPCMYPTLSTKYY